MCCRACCIAIYQPSHSSLVICVPNYNIPWHFPTPNRNDTGSYLRHRHLPETQGCARLSPQGCVGSVSSGEPAGEIGGSVCSIDGEGCVSMLLSSERLARSSAAAKPFTLLTLSSRPVASALLTT